MACWTARDTFWRPPLTLLPLPRSPSLSAPSGLLTGLVVDSGDGVSHAVSEDGCGARAAGCRLAAGKEQDKSWKRTQGGPAGMGAGYRVKRVSWFVVGDTRNAGLFVCGNRRTSSPQSLAPFFKRNAKSCAYKHQRARHRLLYSNAPLRHPLANKAVLPPRAHAGGCG